MRAWIAIGVLFLIGSTPGSSTTASGREASGLPNFATLVAQPVALKPELRGVHPRVFVTASEIEVLRERARTTHRDEWQRVLDALPALGGAPPPPPGPQARRSQNNVAFAIAGAALAYAVERRPEYLAAAKGWTLAAIDYEPWGYVSNKPNTDLAAGHLLYAIGWAYDLLYSELSPAERDRIRASLERHATLVYDAFAPKGGRQFNFTQNHDFIPTSGLAIAALALLGESRDAERWAALARAHHHRANSLLSPDGWYYEGMEYWIFSAPWLVHFYDAWEHSTGESLWELGPSRRWTPYLAHTLLPDGQRVFDFGDVWEGPLTRAGEGEEYDRVYPGSRLQSNFNVMYRVASHFHDPEAQSVAERFRSFGHSNLEEYWTLLWRDPQLRPASIEQLPLTHHFEDMGVVCTRTSWDVNATAVAFKAGPPEGHRVARTAGTLPEWSLDSGHAHPDNGSFIIWANGRYLTGDTGYAGQPQARHHNTITIGGVGQGNEGDHDVWQRMTPAALDPVRITSARRSASGLIIEAQIAAAYPENAALTHFLRRFTFEFPGTFSIVDEVATSNPRSVQWFLHTDVPIARRGHRFAAGPLVTEPASAGMRATIEPTILTAPGEPGSITKGAQAQRGYQLVLETAPAMEARIAVRLWVR